MFGFSVSLFGLTASFREPGAHLYQATLPLPPVSALVGMAGAAVGMSFEDAWLSFKASGLFVGVSGKAGGSGIDLWSYHKMATPKGDERVVSQKYALSKATRTDILNREFLASPRFKIFYAMEERNEADKLRKAFCDPFFAISLGNSDDIAAIEKISELSDVKAGASSDFFRHALLPGDHSAGVSFDWGAIKSSSVTQTLKAPIVRNLIVDFAFEKTERRGIRYLPFTFLSGFQRLKNPQRAFQFGDEESPVALFRLGD